MPALSGLQQCTAEAILLRISKLGCPCNVSLPCRWYRRTGILFWPAAKQLLNAVHANLPRHVLRLHSMLVGARGNFAALRCSLHVCLTGVTRVHAHMHVHVHACAVYIRVARTHVPPPPHVVLHALGRRHIPTSIHLRLSVSPAPSLPTA